MIVYSPGTWTPIHIGSPVRISAPTALPVSLAELKAHCRVDLDEDNALLMGYLRAAVNFVEEYTGLALITQMWQQTASAFPADKIPLSKRPLQAVTGISYLDTDGAAAVANPAIYRVVGIGSDKTPGAVWLTIGQAWPSVYTAHDAVTVTYRVGFGDTHNDVPELIRHALLILVKTFYDFRDDGALPTNTRSAAESLIAEWRPLGVA